jgi:hypothetical protein
MGPEPVSASTWPANGPTLSQPENCRLVSPMRSASWGSRAGSSGLCTLAPGSVLRSAYAGSLPLTARPAVTADAGDRRPIDRAPNDRSPSTMVSRTGSTKGHNCIVASSRCSTTAGCPPCGVRPGPQRPPGGRAGVGASHGVRDPGEPALHRLAGVRGEWVVSQRPAHVALISEEMSRRPVTGGDRYVQGRLADAWVIDVARARPEGLTVAVRRGSFPRVGPAGVRTSAAARWVDRRADGRSGSSPSSTRTFVAMPTARR